MHIRARNEILARAFALQILQMEADENDQLLEFSLEEEA